MRFSILALAVISAALTGPGSAGAIIGANEVVLSFSNLATLDEAVEGHYEGWAVLNGSPVTTGKFNVNGAGMPVGLGGGAVIPKFDAGLNISNATAIKITIEPPGDMDAIPSGLVIVGGDVVGRQAPLAADLPGRETLENSTSGSFLLATPSDNAVDPDNDDMGIWFLTLPGPAAGLIDLPDLGSKWMYEGWVVDVSNPNAPVPYSSGRFSAASGFDSDAAGCNGGGPPFPGQDFTAFHCGPVLDLDTGDFVAVVTVEPQPDNLPGPFQLKPLAGPIPTDALGMDNPLTNQALATFPVGTARLSRFGATSERFKDDGTEATSWGDLKSRFGTDR